MATSKSNIDQTSRTNAIVHQVQSETISYPLAYWRLLELTRTIEIENNKLHQSLRKLKTTANPAEPETPRKNMPAADSK